jgi:hypothetical protein
MRLQLKVEKSPGSEPQCLFLNLLVICRWCPEESPFKQPTAAPVFQDLESDCTAANVQSTLYWASDTIGRGEQSATFFTRPRFPQRHAKFARWPQHFMRFAEQLIVQLGWLAKSAPMKAGDSRRIHDGGTYKRACYARLRNKKKRKKGEDRGCRCFPVRTLLLEPSSLPSHKT